jgi:hypothetical protein
MAGAKRSQGGVVEGELVFGDHENRIDFLAMYFARTQLYNLHKSA